MDVSRTKADNAPDAITIKATRAALGITQREASIYAKTTLRSWQQWEQGHRLMHPAIWSYFLIATAPLSPHPIHDISRPASDCYQPAPRTKDFSHA